jgi:hypothetical protein
MSKTWATYRREIEKIVKSPVTLAELTKDKSQHKVKRRLWEHDLANVTWAQ